MKVAMTPEYDSCRNFIRPLEDIPGFRIGLPILIRDGEVTERGRALKCLVIPYIIMVMVASVQAFVFLGNGLTWPEYKELGQLAGLSNWDVESCFIYVAPAYITPIPMYWAYRGFADNFAAFIECYERFVFDVHSIRPNYTIPEGCTTRLPPPACLRQESPSPWRRG